MFESGYRSRPTASVSTGLVPSQQRSSYGGRSVSPSPANPTRTRSPVPEGTVSSITSSFSSDSSDPPVQQHKVQRRAIPGMVTGGHSVAELQQRFQASATGNSPTSALQPQPHPSRQMRSPSPTKSYSLQQQRKLSFLSHGEATEVDVPEDSSVFSSSDQSGTFPSIVSLSGQSTGSRQSHQSHQSHQSNSEPKVVKEGWVYKKTSLLWKPVYAVARQGTAVKPGGLYLYKDDKFTSHIHTYDMSEVVHVEPWKRDDKAGAKWELRVQVKREDVMLATDSITSRKEWIDSLTSIMGKISMVAHNELQTRTMSAELMSRDLQREVKDLRVENDQLRQKLETIHENHSHDIRNFEAERVARENGLKDEMEHNQETLHSECDRLRMELKSWRDKAKELETEQGRSARHHEAVLKKQAAESQAKVDALERDVRKWRTRAELFEERHNETESYENLGPKKYGARYGGTGGNGGGGRGNNDYGDLADTIKDVKYNLQSLRDQVKSAGDGNPLLQGHVLDIKTAVSKLGESLEDARSGWTELQADIVRFLEAETEDSRTKQTTQVRAMEELKNEVLDLKEELVGIPGDRDAKVPYSASSFTTKLDILSTMVTKLQHSQDELATLCRADAHKDTSTNKIQSSLDNLCKTTVPSSTFDASITSLQDALAAQQRDLAAMGAQSSSMGSKVDDIHASSKDLFDNVVTVLQSSMDDLKEEQRVGQERYEGNLRVLGELLQRVIAKMDGQPQRAITSPTSVTSNALVSRQLSDMLNDGTSPEEVRELVRDTRGFMERTLRVLDRFGGSHAGMEETVRRAVKSAFNSHHDSSWEEKNNSTEEKLKRYEENAQKYIDKSMTGMREHLEEYTGVMYKMIEELVLRAVEHLEQQQKRPLSS